MTQSIQDGLKEHKDSRRITRFLNTLEQKKPKGNGRKAEFRIVSDADNDGRPANFLEKRVRSGYFPAERGSFGESQVNTTGEKFMNDPLYWIKSLYASVNKNSIIKTLKAAQASAKLRAMQSSPEEIEHVFAERDLMNRIGIYNPFR